MIDGPFAEAKEVVAGYWTLQVESTEDALEWATRVASILSAEYCRETEVEVRRLFEPQEIGGGRPESG